MLEQEPDFIDSLAEINDLLSTKETAPIESFAISVLDVSIEHFKEKAWDLFAVGRTHFIFCTTDPN